jgi:hypothetical protein
VSQFAADLNSQTLGALNTMADKMTEQSQAAVNSVIANLYNGSNLPQMKLPIVAVRNVTTTDCEILVPAGAVCHLWIIGKVANPLNGYLPRTLSQMNQPDILSQLRQLLPHVP